MIQSCFPDVDGGEGFIQGSCSGGTLNIILYTTKPVDLHLVQWAAAPRSQWPSGMNTCGSECSISSDQKRVDIAVPNASGNRRIPSLMNISSSEYTLFSDAKRICILGLSNLY